MAVPAGRLGLILKRMAETGERATQAHGGANVPTMSRDATPTLADLGIPRDRAENVAPRDIIPASSDRQRQFEDGPKIQRRAGLAYFAESRTTRLASHARCRSGQSHRPR